MSPVSARLLHHSRRIAQELPAPTLEAVIDLLLAEKTPAMRGSLTRNLLQMLPKASWRQRLAELLDIWQQEAKHLSAEAVATALATAAYCQAASAEEFTAELVWTGPNPEAIPLRRTDQALLQIIREAQHDLTVVSFAVYKIPEIVQALVAAIQRDVTVRLIIETPEASDGKIPFGGSSALGPILARQAQIFVWPKDRRPVDSNGKHGSLHAKCAVADDLHLFISSANLTEYALALNMEMGVVLHNQTLAQQVVHHINCLILQRDLVRLHSGI